MPEESSCAAIAAEEASAGGDEREDSIEQYMVGLLQRVRGLTTAFQAAPFERSKPSASQPQIQPSTAARSQAANVSQADATSPADEASVREPARVPAERHAAESMESVSNMRQLANLNASLAIQTHSARQRVINARRTLGFAATTMLACFLFLRTPVGAQPAGCIVALFSTLVAAACCWQYFRISREMACKSLAVGEEQPAESCPSQ